MSSTKKAAEPETALEPPKPKTIVEKLAAATARRERQKRERLLDLAQAAADGDDLDEKILLEIGADPGMFGRLIELKRRRAHLTEAASGQEASQRDYEAAAKVLSEALAAQERAKREHERNVIAAMNARDDANDAAKEARAAALELAQVDKALEHFLERGTA